VDKGFKRPTLWNHPRVLVARLLRGWTLVAWLAACVLAIFLYSAGFQFGEMMGVVETVVEPVTPLETARLVSVDVTLGQRVKAGDVVAKMDTGVLDAEIALAKAEMAEAEQTVSGYQRDMLQTVRQCEIAIKDAEAAIETINIQYQSDKAELDELAKEQKRRDAMMAKKLISETEASVLRPQIAALEHALAAYPSLLKVQTRRLEQVKKEQVDMKSWLRVEGDGDISTAIRQKMSVRSVIFKATLDMRILRREGCNLRATRDGVVSLIEHTSGDVVPSGDAIVRMVSEHSDVIVGFLPEVHLSDLTVGQKTWVWRVSGRGKKVGATVESIGPEVQLLPGRVSPIRGQPLRGRRVMLKLEGSHDLIPGETVQISNAESSWANLKRQLSLFLGR